MWSFAGFITLLTMTHTLLDYPVHDAEHSQRGAIIDSKHASVDEVYYRVTKNLVYGRCKRVDIC